MVRNYLKGATGDEMNVMLSAAAMNFIRIMNLLKQNLFSFLFNFYSPLTHVIFEIFIQELNVTF